MRVVNQILGLLVRLVGVSAPSRPHHSLARYYLALRGESRKKLPTLVRKNDVRDG